MISRETEEEKRGEGLYIFKPVFNIFAGVRRGSCFAISTSLLCRLFFPSAFS